MRDPECIFCKIADGKLPSSKVYEDDFIFAFLDINPVNPGHTVVIPKNHYENIYETPEELSAKILIISRNIAMVMKSELGALGTNFILNNDPSAGQVISHTHLHIIPRYDGDSLENWPQGKYKEGEKEKIAKRLKNALTD